MRVAARGLGRRLRRHLVCSGSRRGRVRSQTALTCQFLFPLVRQPRTLTGMVELIVQLVILPFRLLAMIIGTVINAASRSQSGHRPGRRSLAQQRFEYNPAPGWPPPPYHGWMPSPGWQPDRSWPRAPIGWRIVRPVGAPARDFSKLLGYGLIAAMGGPLLIIVILSGISSSSSPAAYVPPAAPASVLDSPTPAVPTEAPDEFPPITVQPTHRAKVKAKPRPVRTRPPSHRPTPRKTTKAPSAPSGATALCNDGTFSYSQHHQGTCSHHHGVAKWL